MSDRSNIVSSGSILSTRGSYTCDAEPAMSHLFAYFSRMKFIRRWGLMRSTHPENVQEHSHRVALVAHALALARNRLFGGQVDATRVAVLALYHDSGEVLTGDLPSPIKYRNPDIRSAYHEIESTAAATLLAMVPEPLRDEYRPLLLADAADDDERAIVKAADKLCAWMKCLEETAAGNREFASAEESLRQVVQSIDLPEVRWFVETFVPSLRLTLDELG
jgi:5'-deoxynucleotidase